MSPVPTKAHTWTLEAVESALAYPMAAHLAIQPLVQNEVDQILKETHLHRWTSWKHEDLREHRGARRKPFKKNLLKEIPGLLSGPHASALHADVWQPIYILSATIPREDLVDTIYTSDLKVVNVMWQHTEKKLIALTLFNNHLDPAAHFAHFVLDGASTNRASQWAVGHKGTGFIRAAHYLFGALRSSSPRLPGDVGVGLRVGNTTGEFAWYRKPENSSSELVLRQRDLTPLSLKNIEGRPDFRFPFDENLPIRAENTTRISAIYNYRFLVKMSERSEVHPAGGVPTEPAHERSFVRSDEVAVTVIGLSDSHTPEYLFSGIYGIFRPRQEWTIAAPGGSLVNIIFYLSEAEAQPGFFCRDYLVPLGQALNRVGVNYQGELDLSPTGLKVQVTGEAFRKYRTTLAIALDIAIRTIPALAAELALDILTESPDTPDSFGRILSLHSTPADDDGKQAYRAAFQDAWRRLDATLADGHAKPYPYVTSTDPINEKLIKHLEMKPVLVQPHVKVLLEKSGAFPPIKTFAQSLLLMAPGAPMRPLGIDVLCKALVELFPHLSGEPVSLRNYPYLYPSVAWAEDENCLVVSSSLKCRCSQDRERAESPGEAQDENDNYAGGTASQICLCWIGIALQAAVTDWQLSHAPTSYPIAPEAMTSPVTLNERLFHTLFKLQEFSIPLVPHAGLGLDGLELEYPALQPDNSQNDDMELDYMDILPSAGTVQASYGGVGGDEPATQASANLRIHTPCPTPASPTSGRGRRHVQTTQQIHPSRASDSSSTETLERQPLTRVEPPLLAGQRGQARLPTTFPSIVHQLSQLIPGATAWFTFFNDHSHELAALHADLEQHQADASDARAQLAHKTAALEAMAAEKDEALKAMEAEKNAALEAMDAEKDAALETMASALNAQREAAHEMEEALREAVRRSDEREKELTERLQYMEAEVERAKKDRKEAKERFQRGIQLLNMLQREGMSVEPQGPDEGGLDSDEEQDRPRKKRARVDETDV